MSRVLSSLLTTRENGLLFSLLGTECYLSACGVVQLYMATAAPKSRKSEWKLHSCGVGCLVQDRKLHSTFIQLFCIKRAKLLWKQELYTPFKYSTPLPFFHTFQTDNCWAGLNFASEDEASQFCSAVRKCISTAGLHAISHTCPVITRTRSLDSASALLLRNKLNSCLSVSLNHNRESCTSPKPPSSFASGSLVQRKGPLPPIPSNAQNTLLFSHREV